MLKTTYMKAEAWKPSKSGCGEAHFNSFELGCLQDEAVPF
jgi:hypothetical protein